MLYDRLEEEFSLSGIKSGGIILLSLSANIEFVKYLKEKFLGRRLKSLEILCVVECVLDFGVVIDIAVSEDIVSITGADAKVFRIKLDDIVNLDYNPRQEGVCLEIEAKDEVKVLFYID